MLFKEAAVLAYTVVAIESLKWYLKPIVEVVFEKLSPAIIISGSSSSFWLIAKFAPSPSPYKFPAPLHATLGFTLKASLELSCQVPVISPNA